MRMTTVTPLSEVHMTFREFLRMQENKYERGKLYGLDKPKPPKLGPAIGTAGGVKLGPAAYMSKGLGKPAKPTGFDIGLNPNYKAARIRA